VKKNVRWSSWDSVQLGIVSNIYLLALVKNDIIIHLIEGPLFQGAISVTWILLGYMRRS
jgi:hypothetical protein